MSRKVVEKFNVGLGCKQYPHLHTYHEALFNQPSKKKDVVAVLQTYQNKSVHPNLKEEEAQNLLFIGSQAAYGESRGAAAI